MSETRTPGPWTVTGCAGGYLIEQNHNMDKRVVRGSGGIKSRADARLIAAAPDLLDACEIAAEALGGAGLLSVMEMVERAMIKAVKGDT